MVNAADKAEILIADSDLTTLRHLKLLLEREGYAATIAPSRAEAMGLLRTRQPELLLVDDSLSEGGGLDLCQQLHDDPQTSGIPIILLTAAENTVARIHGLTLGAADFVVKPFESMELLARVRVQVRLRHILREKTRLQKEVEQSRVATLAANMARGVAHNYLNLLTGIQGYVGLMEFAVGEDRELVDHLQQVKDLIARATRMTNDLSACARLVTIQREEVFLSDLFAELFRPLEEWGGKWRLHVQEISGTGSLSCNLKYLRRVMTILFANAAEAMPAGGTITLQATVVAPVLEPWETGPAPKYLQIQVQDHGKGLPACEAEKVFEPFFTTKVTVGAGLSLAVAQAIVLSHGGHLQFESRLGCGSRVTLRFPLHERETRQLSNASRISHLQIQQ